VSFSTNPATPLISPLSLHDALPISRCLKRPDVFQVDRRWAQVIEEANALTQENMGNAHVQFVEQTCLQGLLDGAGTMQSHVFLRSEEHTSELQSRFDLVCRLLLEKK